MPGILKFAKEGLQVTLALSLHAPNDEVRKTLMPVANGYRLEDILDACHTYFEATGRRLTFEYSLVKGVNDINLKEAAALMKLIKDQHGHVNLIPVNPIKERDYVQSDRRAIEAFSELSGRPRHQCHGPPGEMGRDIGGACGQLRKSYIEGGDDMEAYALTDIRRRVRSMNQDYIYASQETIGSLPNLFLVADGMGGHQAGDFASRYAVEHLVVYSNRCQKGAAVAQLQEGSAR